MTIKPHIISLLLLAGCATAPVTPVALPPVPQEQTVATKATPKTGLVAEESLTVSNRPRNDDLFWQPVPGADGYRISAGEQRWKWSTNWITKDNFVLNATNFPAYGVSAFNQFMETPVTPWPSNIFYVPVIKYYTDPTLTKKLGELKLSGATTNPAMFMVIENRYDHSE